MEVKNVKMARDSRIQARLPSVPLSMLVFLLLSSLPFSCLGHLVANLAFGTGVLNYPTGIAVDPTSTALFVTDSNNNRVLRFDNRNTLTSASTPSFAFGQPSLSGNKANWDSVSPHASARGLNFPTGITVDAKGTLWVSDTNNGRVLRFNNAASATTMPLAADGVIGWPNFTASTESTVYLSGIPDTFESPIGIRTNGSDLWVADSGQATQR